ncbi:MAG: helix-turn-helix transcriptional regulator [Paraclostridium sp.]|uniref:helix-turn-helix transcriptional regulator n=1 Tax=Paraclostridium sp. TaxID=2023273 RepID=UPI003F2BF8D3
MICIIYKNNLKGIRVSRGLTQGDLAKLINMPRSTYIKKENEQSYFNIKEAMKISNVLNLSIDYIFLSDSYQIGKK